jgi:hypothetical protein
MKTTATLHKAADPALDVMADRFGRAVWLARMASISADCTNTYAGRALAQRHALELTIERLRRAGPTAMRTSADHQIASLAADLAALPDKLSAGGQARLHVAMANALCGANTLVDLLHLLHVAALHRDLGYEVHYAGLNDGATFDLLVSKLGVEAEIICDVVSAEAGRDVHRSTWSTLADRVDPDLQAWLAAHPGRYMLKMTLPKGLKGTAETTLADLHSRITNMLVTQQRAHHDEAVVLRLDPLMLAASQAPELGLMPNLRREFGPEAHLAVAGGGKTVFVMAARAAREDEVAEAVQRRMAELLPRLSNARPAILAMFVEDTDRVEWRSLRDQLQLEGAARQFLTRHDARSVVAVTCGSRAELVDPAEAELRFRNPGHKQAKAPALAAAIAPSC